MTYYPFTVQKTTIDIITFYRFIFICVRATTKPPGAAVAFPVIILVPFIGLYVADFKIASVHEE